jgi:streptomycin 6-kinase
VAYYHRRIRSERSALEPPVAQLAERWALSVDEPFPLTPGSPGNFVAPVVRADGTQAVLKVSHYVEETRTEIAALQRWSGSGAACLLEADPDLGALLLERVLPGTMLAAVDDDTAVHVAAEILLQLWQPLTTDAGLRSLESWCAAYDRNRSAILSGGTLFPKGLFQRADALRNELLDSTTRPVVLHGDLHHFNILKSDRTGWLAIDPKGLFGDRYFDICQFLRNPGPVSSATNRRRLDLFAAELKLDRQRLSAWCLVHAVLDACWSLEDGHDWRPKVAYAEETLMY